jgi:hypothetical protein
MYGDMLLYVPACVPGYWTKYNAHMKCIPFCYDIADELEDTGMKTKFV